MAASATLQAVISENAVAIGQHVLRHGGHAALVQDVLRSMPAWAGPAMLVLCKAITGKAAAAEVQAIKPQDLTGEQLDAAFVTLKLLSGRLATLSGMAHEPHSRSSNEAGITIGTQSWLMPHKTHNQRYWQYGYEVQFTNNGTEPLQLLRKAWEVKELSGAYRSRSSAGILGLQPVIASGESLSVKTAITLDSFKGSMSGELLMKGMRTGAMFAATVGAFALTPTEQQYSDPQYMSAELLVPASASAARLVARPCLAVQQAPSQQQQQQQAVMPFSPPVASRRLAGST